MFRWCRYDMIVVLWGFVGREFEGFMFEATRRFKEVMSAILSPYLMNFQFQ